MNATKRVALVVLALLLAACAAQPVAAPPQVYRILVTNDDGIESPGIAALAAALKPFGEVVVVAPKVNQSGASHSITGLLTPVHVTKVEREGALFGHAVTGTPTDSVLAALHWVHPGQKFDLLVSGINYGTNVGNGAYYSGTVGAALEGALNGIPSLAFSQDAKLKDDFARSAQVAAEIVASALRHGLPAGTYLNVNIPAGELKGYRVAPVGGSYYVLEKFETVGTATDGTTGLKPKLKIGEGFPEGSDTQLYAQGYVTLTPLHIDLSRPADVRALRAWSLQLPATAVTAPDMPPDQRLALAALLAAAVSAAGAQEPQPAAEPSTEELATIPVNIPAEEEPAPEGDTTRLESITVTANKRAQPLQEVPMSISAIRGKDLEKNGQKTFHDYALTVPALNFGYYGEGRARINLRGLQAPTGVATVAYLVDGVAQSATPPDLELFDMDRVEVLRGPQGTLYGEGAVGGAIKLLTNSANPHAFLAKALGSYSVNEAGAPEDSENAMVNVPLIDGALGLRAVGFRRHSDGYVTVREPNFNNPPGLKSYSNDTVLATDANVTDVLGGRVSLDWYATPDLTVRAKYSTEVREATYGAVESPLLVERYGGHQVERGSNPLVSDFTNHDYRQTTVNVSWNLPFANLESISGLADNKEDILAGVFVVLPAVETGAAIVGVPLPVPVPQLPPLLAGVLNAAGLPTQAAVGDMFDFRLINQYSYLTQELRLVSLPTGGPWTLTGGVFYKIENREAFADVIPGPNLEVIGVDKIELEFHTEEYAVYGQAEYAFTPSLTGILGTRYYHADLLQKAAGGGVTPAEFRPEYDDISPKLTLSYRWTDNVLVYGTVAKGFRVGGANFATVNPPPENMPDTYDPDELWSYEAGINSALLDQRVMFNAAIFSANWENLQNEIRLRSDAQIDPGGATPDDPTAVLAPGGDQRAVFNAGKAYSRGVELEMTALLPLDLTWTLGGAYLDAALAQDMPNPAFDGGVIGAGTPLENVPQWAGSSSLSHDFRLANGWGITSAIDWRYRGDTHGDILNPRESISKAYTLLNLRFGVAGADQSWDADLFVKNLTNERASSFTFQHTPQQNTLGDNTDVPATRRTIGLRLRYDF